MRHVGAGVLGAARRARRHQAVRDRSLSLVSGVYRQPPAAASGLLTFCALRSTATSRRRAASSVARLAGTGSTPAASASAKVTIAWPYMRLPSTFPTYPSAGTTDVMYCNAPRTAMP